MQLVVASDHAGYALKGEIVRYLKLKGHIVEDLGTHSPEPVDYSDYGHLIADHIHAGKSALGFSFCGSGNGINMTANKHALIRSALCWNVEIARLSRAHNNANICAIPARFISYVDAVQIVDAFLSAEYEGGRHENRIRKIPMST